MVGGVSKLDEIRQTVAALEFARKCVLDDEANGILDGTNANQDRVHDAELAIYAHAEDWLIALLPAVQAAQDVVLCHPMGSRSKELDTLIAALAKLE